MHGYKSKMCLHLNEASRWIPQKRPSEEGHPYHTNSDPSSNRFEIYFKIKIINFNYLQ